MFVTFNLWMGHDAEPGAVIAINPAFVVYLEDADSDAEMIVPGVTKSIVVVPFSGTPAVTMRPGTMVVTTVGQFAVCGALPEVAEKLDCPGTNP